MQKKSVITLHAIRRPAVIIASFPAENKPVFGLFNEADF
jgi:hypothetical protein